MPLCSVIIPVYNRAFLTRQCLDRLLADPPCLAEWEIIVVDDASTDTTPALLASYGDSIHVVAHQQNVGFALACNDGATLAKGDYVVFLNNDTIPLNGWLDALVRYAEVRQQVAAVGSKLLFPNGTVQHAGVVFGPGCQPLHIYLGFPLDHPAVNKSRRFPVVTGGCMLVRRSAFEEVGGFDAAYRNGYEDVDLCLRLGQRGYEVHYCHDSVLFHLESVSEGRNKHEAQNAGLFRERWAGRVHSDDWQYYLDDGLIEIRYTANSPPQIRVSPELALINAETIQPEIQGLLARRTRQVYELLRENILLRVQRGLRAESSLLSTIAPPPATGAGSSPVPLSDKAVA